MHHFSNWACPSFILGQIYVRPNLFSCLFQKPVRKTQRARGARVSLGRWWRSLASQSRLLTGRSSSRRATLPSPPSPPSLRCSSPVVLPLSCSLSYRSWGNRIGLSIESWANAKEWKSFGFVVYSLWFLVIA